MKAKIEHRQNLKNRLELKEVIPLNAPLTIFIDPSNKCNFKCNFCPTGDSNAIKKSGRMQTHMDFNLYKKIIDDLKELNSEIKILRLYKDGEPLLNPNIIKMIHYAKESGVFQMIEMTTNGSLLNEELNIQLVESGLNRIHISVEGVTKEHYKKFSKYNINYESFLNNIEHLFRNKQDLFIYIKANGDYLNYEEKEKFYADFGDKADSIFLEHFSDCWPNFNMKDIEANSIYTNYGGNLPDYIAVCPYIFYAPAIHSDGTVSLCCNDWEGKVSIGTLQSQSFKEIWNGQKHIDYQIMHLSKQRHTHPVCGKCNRPQYFTTDNLDDSAELILKRIKVDD